MPKNKLKQECTKYGQIYLILKDFEIGQKIDKIELITKLWGRHDYFIERSFDVHFVSAKKMLPDFKFVSEKKIIRRKS